MPVLPSERTEKIAINLFDLDRIDPSIRGELLKDKLDLTKPLDMSWDRKESKDEVAVAFKCDVHTAATVCDLIRSYDRKAGDFPTRLYLCRKEWTRIPSHVQLTNVIEDSAAPAGKRVILNPSIFKPIAVPAAPLVAQKPKRVL